MTSPPAPQTRETLTDLAAELVEYADLVRDYIPSSLSMPTFARWANICRQGDSELSQLRARVEQAQDEIAHLRDARNMAPSPDYLLACLTVDRDTWKQKAEAAEQQLATVQAQLSDLRESAVVVTAARDRIDLRENDVPRQQCIVRLSAGELGHLNQLLAALASSGADHA